MKMDTEHYVQYPTYKGDYQIKGTTSAGRKLSAIARYNPIYSDEISLNDVTLGNTSELNRQNVIEARYCLANCPILLKISTPFLNYQDGFILTPNSRIFDSQNQYIRISTMILKNPNGMAEEEYKNYSTWFKLIFSFASGHNVEEIYSVKIFKVGNSTQELEYWSGEGYSYSKASGIKVIERLDEFICKVGSAVNYENFDQKGLGTALGWYVDCFNTTFAPTRFIILCTILETLSEKCLAFFKGEYTESEQIKKAIFEALEQEDIKEILDLIEEEKQSFKRETLQKDDEFRQKLKDALKTPIDKHLSHSQKQTLIETEYYNKIKNKILDIFNKTKDKINDEKITKYDICKQKIEQAFKGEFDNFNKPTFASKINYMLNRYKVTYEDLFEGIDSLAFLQQLNNVRNDLIHRGYSPIEKLKSYSVKLDSLVVRIILSIIEYDGYYWERKKVEFSNPPQYNIYDRKHIPLKKK